VILLLFSNISLSFESDSL